MNVSRVTYTLHLNLGQYSHQEFHAEVVGDPTKEEDGDAMMKLAQRVVFAAKTRTEPKETK